MNVCRKISSQTWLSHDCDLGGAKKWDEAHRSPGENSDGRPLAFGIVRMPRVQNRYFDGRQLNSFHKSYSRRLGDIPYHSFATGAFPWSNRNRAPELSDKPCAASAGQPLYDISSPPRRSSLIFTKVRGCRRQSGYAHGPRQKVSERNHFPF